MRNRLENNTVIWFDPAENGSFKHSIRITDCIGEGGTGLIYTGTDDTGIVWVVKESFPNTENSIFNSVHVYRKEDGNIAVYGDQEGYDLNTEVNRILENENEVALALQNDLTNGIMSMPFYNGILKGAAIQLPDDDMITACNQVFTRMQYIKGVTADKAVFADVLDRLKAVEDILSAVARIHKAGFILGDIKPQNIMLADGVNGRCFVLDYGSAVRADDEGKAWIDPLKYPRSSGYIGPELFVSEGNAYLTKAYDVYSLGALLMDMLMPQRTKRIRKIQHNNKMEYPYSFLFEDLQNYGAFSKLSVQQELPVSPALADQLSLILQKCLADDRDMRYRDADELLEDYRQFVNNYQYKTVKPQKYDYHLLWQASYDSLEERLGNTLEHRTDNINDVLSKQKKPDWWKLEPIKAYDQQGSCYQDIETIREALKDEPVYLYADGGRGKTMKACQIMLRCLWEMPVFYIDAGLWTGSMDSPDDLFADDIFNQAYLDYSCLPDGFNESLKNQGDRFLIVIDNINNLYPLYREAFFGSVNTLMSEFTGAEIMLIGRNEIIGDEHLDSCLRKIKLGMIEGQENEMLRIPFFYMLYQKTKHDDPEFVLDTESEVRFLETYMDSLGTDYYKHERKLMDIALAMAEGFYFERYIDKSELEEILSKEHSGSEIKEIVHTLTDKLGLLVPLSRPLLYCGLETEIYEFAHDIYQDYFTAKRIALLIKDAVAHESLNQLSSVNMFECDPDAVRMLMELADQKQLDKLYCLIISTDIHDTECNGFIRSFVNYYWECENHTVNRWAELGVRHMEDLSMAVSATDLITRITPDDHKPLDQAVDLCSKAIAQGTYWTGSDWPKEYLGMLILHDAAQKAGISFCIDTEYFDVMTYYDEMPDRYYRIEGPIGKIDGLTVKDGLELLFGGIKNKGMTAILTDLAGESEEPETGMPLTAKHKDAIMVKRRFWNVVKDMETDENIMVFKGNIKLGYLTTVIYEGNNYAVFVTEDNRDSGIKEIIILKESGFEADEGKELQLVWETVDDMETRMAAFNIFMNEKDGKEAYEVIE